MTPAIPSRSPSALSPHTSAAERSSVPSLPAVEARALRCNYGAFPAVRGVDLQVDCGELYALLGSNGAGKTTTLETLEGLRAPTSGAVRVFGRNPLARRQVRPQVGIMAQESGFAPDLTPLETVALTGRLSGRHDDPAAVLVRVGLTHRHDVRVAQLSGGEKRRLDFACASYGSPALLFLDEPTTGLDLTARDQVWDCVGRLREAGTTVVLTTHYLEEAERHADRVALMHGGLVRYEGTVSDVAASFAATIAFRAPQLPGDRAGGAGTGPQCARQWAERIAHPERGVPGLERDGVEADGAQVVIRTHRLQRDLHALLGWAAAQNAQLLTLTARPATLDDIFRDLAASQAGGPDAQEVAA